MDILQAVRQLRPGTAWTLIDGVLEQAADGTPRVNPPTSDEIQAILSASAYRDLREYPSVGDQLDAIWKGGQAAADMLVQIQAVKAKYPKGA